jgi:hypothetical protein
VLDRPLAAGDLAAGGNTPEAEPPAMSRPDKGLFVRRTYLAGTPVQIFETPPLKLLLFHVNLIPCLVKFITIHRKI